MLDVILAFSIGSFRFTRFLRPLLLPIWWSGLQRRVRSARMIAPYLLEVLCLLAVFAVGYGIAGFLLFRGQYDPQDGRFDDFASSILAVFVLLTGDNYPDILYDACLMAWIELIPVL